MIFFLAKNELARMAGLDRAMNEDERIHEPLNPDCRCIRCQRRRFMAQLKPLRFGYGINFTATTTYTLAAYNLPHDVQLIVFRVECTMTDFTTVTADFGLTDRVPNLPTAEC